MAQALEIYFDIEAHSWKAQSGEVIRQDANLLDFYRQMMHRFAENQQAVVDLLLLDGQPICGVLSLRYQRHLLTLKTAYRQTFAKYSPGWQIFRALLEDAFSGGAIEAVDFYADIGFSSRWATQENAFCDLLVFGTSLRGRLAGVAKGVQDRLKKWVSI